MIFKSTKSVHIQDQDWEIDAEGVIIPPERYLGIMDWQIQAIKLTLPRRLKATISKQERENLEVIMEDHLIDTYLEQNAESS
jgi:hypothetical protein